MTRFIVKERGVLPSASAECLGDGSPYRWGPWRTIASFRKRKEAVALCVDLIKDQRSGRGCFYDYSIWHKGKRIYPH
jgi:hypothetical protein